MCTARVTIDDRPISVLFHVLPQCPHDLILGLDFLGEHSALIDCASGFVRLELPQAATTVDDMPSRLRSTKFVRLSPQAATCVPLSPCPPVEDGDYIISPITDILLSRDVTLPHTVVTVQNNQICIPVLNFGHIPQILPIGMSLATLSPLTRSDIFSLSASASPSSSHGPHPSLSF